MPDKPKYYLTTPIYYTNGLPHIGHVYTTIVCDTVRRFKRMRGFDVVMTTGTDEHGVNVERAAQKAGVPESEFVARMPKPGKRCGKNSAFPPMNSSAPPNFPTLATYSRPFVASVKTTTAPKATS